MKLNGVTMTQAVVPTCTSRADSDPSGCQVAIGAKTVAAPAATTMSYGVTSANRTAQAVVAIRPFAASVPCQASGGDGCSSLCAVDPGWTCPFPKTSCVAD